MAFISEATKSLEVVNIQNKLIDQNLEHRRDWEDDCKMVQLSYRGNKFPVKEANLNTNTISQKIKRSSKDKGYLNLVKRQWRVISNYLLNNEPAYILSKKKGGIDEGYLEEVREILNLIFDGSDEENEGFYDTVMDDTIFYGVHRGICWTLAYFDPDLKEYRFKTYDPMDTYIDLDSDKLSNITKFLHTYNKPKSELKSKYKTQFFGEPIEWDNVNTDQEKTASNVKKSMLKEVSGSETILIREGYYLENDALYRALSTNTLCLSVEKIADMKFMPVTWFAPMPDPSDKYPRGWFVDMVQLEKEINILVNKLATIIRTGGRFVYVRAGTTLTKSTNNLLNQLGIEVIEVSGAQQLPNQANLLQISQSDIQFLNILLSQAEEEGGMKSDIMGTSSTGANASGRAIQALQAGSKNNIGPALNELNKYMTRLVRILLRMFKIFGTSSYYSEKLERDIQTEGEMDKKVKIKVSITGRDAFDEVTQVLNAIDILNMIQKFNPETQIPPEVITKLMGVTNEIADDIREELEKQEDPDLQIAEGQAKKLLQGIPQNANENDNHQVFIAIFSETLKNVPPDSPAADALIGAIKMHEAFLQGSEQQ